jgi:hypothetical protein
LIKERWVSKNFLMAGLKQPLREGEDGFVDDPILGGVAGIVVDCDEVIPTSRAWPNVATLALRNPSANNRLNAGSLRWRCILSFWRSLRAILAIPKGPSIGTFCGWAAPALVKFAATGALACTTSWVLADPLVRVPGLRRIV